MLITLYLSIVRNGHFLQYKKQFRQVIKYAVETQSL